MQRLSTLLVGLLCTALTAKAQDLSTIKQAKPLSLTGNIGINTTYYEQSGFKSSVNPMGYGIAASLVPSIYGVALPFNFVYAKSSKSISQPFNQFSLSPTYKWIKLHGGYTHLNFSPSSLAGKTILGAGVELTPGILRVGFVYGQYNARIIADTAFIQTPAYRRMGLAGKIGIGRENNFFDLIVLHAKDDQNSLPNLSAPFNETITPQENVLGGFNSKFTIKKHWILESDASESAYTKDVRSTELDLSDTRLTKYNKYIKKIMIPRLSSGIAYYAHGNFRYQQQAFSLGVDYKRIAPNYYSMGVDYSYDDLEAIQVQSSFLTFKSKLFAMLGTGVQTDNLNELKGAKTQRKIYTLNLNYTANTHLSIAAAYANYGIAQRDGRTRLNDTIRLENANNNFNCTPVYTYSTSKLIHVVVGSYNYMKMDDKNKFSSKYANSEVNTAFINYALTVQNSNLTIGNTLNYTAINVLERTLENKGYTLQLTKVLLNKKMQTTLSGSYLNNYIQHKKNGNTIIAGLQVNYQINKANNLRLQIRSMQAQSSAKSSELRADLSYNYSF